VLEESTIVAEVTFGESSSGAAVLQGKFVSATTGELSFVLLEWHARVES
jgi:hypothetical protein